MINKKYLNLIAIPVLAAAVNLADEQTTSLTKVEFKKEKLTQVTPTNIDLNINGNYLFYTGSADFGTPSQPNTGTIFDTTQSAIQISGTPCAICNNAKCSNTTACPIAYYNQLASSSQTIPPVTPTTYTNSSLVPYATGGSFQIDDRICYGTTQVCSTASFTVVNQYQVNSQLFPFYTGTVGVGPQSPLWSTTGVGFDLRLASQGQSQLNIGQLAAGYNPASFVYHNLGSGSQQSWNVFLTGVTFGSYNLNQYANYQIATIDSASSQILLSQQDYATFATNIQLIPDMSCTNTLGKLSGNCFSSTTQCQYYISEWPQFFPNISISIDNVVYNLPPTAYLAEGINGVQCQVMVGSTTNTSSGLLLGTPFMRQYYTYLNFASSPKQVGLAPSLYPPVLSPITTGGVSLAWTVVATIVTTLSGILLISLWIWVEWYKLACYKKKASPASELAQ